MRFTRFKIHMGLCCCEDSRSPRCGDSKEHGDPDLGSSPDKSSQDS